MWPLPLAESVDPADADVVAPLMKTEITCPSCHARNRVPIASSGKPRCGKCHTDLPWLADADQAGLEAAVASSSIPILVDLWAPWCGPCRAVAPALVQLANDRAGSLRVIKVNVDDEPAVSAKLGVQGIPTMVLFRDGKEISRQVGALPGPRIGQWVDSSL